MGNSVAACVKGKELLLNTGRKSERAPVQGQNSETFQWRSLQLVKAVEIQEEEAHTSQPNSPLLNPDVLFEILLKLPAELLVQFKCVSKLWRDIISDRIFMGAHLEYWKCRPPGIIFTWMSPSRRPVGHRAFHYWSFDVQKDEIKGVNCLQLYIKDCKDLQSGARILASCNGLLLLNMSSIPRLFICNPMIQVADTLPHPPVNVETCSWALVHDDSTDKYKVFAMKIRKISENKSCDECYAYTLGSSSSWRSLGVPCKHTWISDACVVANKMVHWLAGSEHTEGRQTILYSVDINTEKFEETSTPLPRYRVWHNLLEINGFLYYMALRRGEMLRLWVLKDWNTKIWMQEDIVGLDLYSFINGTAPSPSAQILLYDTWPVSAIVNSQCMSSIIVKDRQELVSFDLKFGEQRYILSESQRLLPFHNALVSGVSLASINSLQVHHVNSLVNSAFQDLIPNLVCPEDYSKHLWTLSLDI
ncbi:putative F-box protein At1g47790 [Tripterygium wilfordii]|uniref:putative F-box protein At1g47790 n=1 Tax=Tripterygium wilfordii TaxID=458696 RepID=UPI0018F8060D|nr:putative F-box protein At1g47790 [Tripterygium wilfordii]